MKLSPFTLIYQPEGELQERSKRRARLATPAPGEVPSTDERLLELGRKAPELVKALRSVNQNLCRALIASSYAQKSVEPKEQVPAKLRRVVADLQRSKDVTTVAIWDLGAKIGGLPDVIHAINRSQPTFTFFELRAPVPGGLVIQAEIFGQWARKRLGTRLSKSAQQAPKNNFMFSDFREYASVVREQIGVDYLVGITQHMVAWEEGENIYWNYFSTSEKEIILVSAYDMREYAAQADRPYEAAVASTIIAQLLQEISEASLFHDENRGCLFDFNEDRDTIVEALRKARIEKACLQLVDEKYRDAAEKMVRALRNYSPKSEGVKGQALKKSSAKKRNKDDTFWLNKLTKLSSRLRKAR